LRSAGWVDDGWYSASNEDVGTAKIDAVEHYVRYGYREGRSPAPELERRADPAG
jgi:hypothetical protein